MSELRTAGPMDAYQRAYTAARQYGLSHGVADQVAKLWSVSPMAGARDAGRDIGAGILSGSPAQVGLGVGGAALAGGGAGAAAGMARAGGRAANVARTARSILPDKYRGLSVGDDLQSAANQIMGGLERGYGVSGQMGNAAAQQARAHSLFGNLSAAGARSPTAMGSVAGGALAAGTEAANAPFDPSSYEDWMRMVTSGATGAAAGMAGAKAGTAVGNRVLSPVRNSTTAQAARARLGTITDDIDHSVGIMSGLRKSERAALKKNAAVRPRARSVKSQADPIPESIGETKPGGLLEDLRTDQAVRPDPNPGTGQSSQRLRNNRVPQFGASKKNKIVESYVENGGKISLTQARRLAPGVPDDKLKKFITKLKNASKEAGDNPATMKRVRDALKVAPIGILGGISAADPEAGL